jgi:MarR family transcriptional regulator for hemolysin
MQLIEPISRKLLGTGKLYLNVLIKSMQHLDINRYHYVLATIHLRDGLLTQKELARLLGKDKSALVSIIDMLTEKGYVYRETNPDDRREHLLKCTDKAKAEVPQILNAFEHMNEKVTEGISENDMQIFEKVINKMKSNLQPFLNGATTKPTKS